MTQSVNYSFRSSTSLDGANRNSDDDNNDRLYLNCVCNATGVSTQLPLCEACVATYDDDGRDTGTFYLPFKVSNPSHIANLQCLDVNDLLTSCSFSTTTYNPSSSYASTSIPASAAVTAISGTNTISVTRSTNPTGASSALSVLSSITATDSTGGVLPQSTNAAVTVGPKALGAGVGLGMLGVAFGMM
jgi:hypothetical protein